MTTFVGTQEDFLTANKELIELDYDAIEAYEAAIGRIKDNGDKTILAAILINERDTVTAYELMSEREDILSETKELIEEGLRNEYRHKAWLKGEIERIDKP